MFHVSELNVFNKKKRNERITAFIYKIIIALKSFSELHPSSSGIKYASKFKNSKKIF